MNKFNLYLLVSLIEALYVIYILRYFKTKISLDYGTVIDFLGLSNNKYFKHQIISTGKPVNHICNFGHQVSILIAFFLIARVCLYKNYQTLGKKINYFVLILIFIGSFMNFNAVIYLIPFFIMELYLNIKLI